MADVTIGIELEARLPLCDIRRYPRRSFYVAVVVGMVLNLINQGDAFFRPASINWLKIALTYFVPYAVCTYGVVSSQNETA